MYTLQDSGDTNRKLSKRLDVWIDYAIVLFVILLAVGTFLIFRTR